VCVRILEEEAMTLLSVLIPARNEIFLQRTIDDVLDHARGDTEVIAVCDGYRPDPHLRERKGLKVIYNEQPIGQRQATNQAARESNAKFLMKLDAHCAVDEGFDVKLAADCEYDWTVLPVMKHLEAFRWVCSCGQTFPQGPEPKCHEVRMDVLWRVRPQRQTEFMFLDPELRARYFDGPTKREYKWTDHYAKHATGDICDVMVGMGPGWFMHRDRYWELGGMDEGHGSWGQMGAEVALKAWLSGGRHVVNRKTWFAHLFRTKPGFSWPYKITDAEIEKARAYSKDLWINDKWPLAKRPFKWVLEHFAPVPGWPVEPIEKEIVVETPKRRPARPYLRVRWKLVSELWDGRYRFRPDAKGKRAIDAYDDLVGRVLAGEAIEPKSTAYYEYLLSVGCRRPDRKFAQRVALIHDIRERGVLCPLEFYSTTTTYHKDARDWRLNDGVHRLVIAHHLGIYELPCRVFARKGYLQKYGGLASAPRIGSRVIEQAAAQQMVALGSRSTNKYSCHGFMPHYDRELAHLTDKRVRILEFGIYEGASLLLWRAAFPRAKVFGVDIRPEAGMLARGLSGIEILTGSQSDAAFLEKQVAPCGPFHIVIDDASHRAKDQIAGFKSLWPHVVPGGFYIVEDLYVDYKYRTPGVSSIEFLKGLVDDIYNSMDVDWVHFYRDICFVRKSGKEKMV
jgi:glycosyltransferase involved in cell wall biosynthesis